MADIKLVGAVAIKVRPYAKGFRGDTQRAIKKELAGVEAEVKIKVKADTSEVDRDVDRAKEKAKKASVTLSVGVDYDSIRRAQQQLDQAIKNLDIEKLKVELDDEGIRDAQAFMDALMEEANVDITFTPDEKGFKSVLDKIAAIRREKIEEEISFGVDHESLDEAERQIRERLAEIVGKQTIAISYNNNRASLQAAIAQVNKELDKLRAVEIDVELTKKALKKARKDLERALAKAPVELKVDYDDQASLKATRARLKEMLTELNAQTLSVAFNEQAIRAELQRLDQMIDDEVKEEREVELPVHTTGLGIVARQLQFASRARRVPFYVVVDQKSLIIAEGLLRSLAGVNTLQSAGRGLETLITKFDTIALKAAGWGAAIGGITDALVYMATSLFAIGDGIAESVGLLAAAPAMLSAIAAGVIINVMAFDNLKKAFDGDTAALEKLTPAAREAFNALDGTWTAIQRPVQQAFWETANVSLREFAEKVIPQLTKGLEGAARGAGLAFDNIIKSFNTLAISGDLEKMFANLDVMFQKTGEAMGPFMEAFNTLGLRGSEFLPRFGQWLLDISTRFRNWIDESDRLGNINAWIEDGVQSLKDMWGAAGGIINQFKAIARATGKLGASGLDDFRRNMEHLGDVMLAEPFQSRLASIFFGARQGASELNEGIKDLGRSFMESANWTSQLLTLLGRFGGDVLSGVSRVFSNFTFQGGALDALRGMSDMVRAMDPAFDRLGSLIGNIGTISSSVFRGLAPVFNSLTGILDDAVSKIAGNLGKLAPTLLTLTNNMLNFARGPITLVVDVLNSFLDVLNGMPGPLKDATVAFGIFLLLRNQFGAFAGALNTLWTNMTTSAVKGSAKTVAATAAVGTAATGVNAKLVMMADGSVRQLSRFGTYVQTSMLRAQADVNRFTPNIIVGKLGLAAAGVKLAVTRINASLALIGGIPGLILGAIGVAIATIGGNAANAAAHVDALHATLDKTTGSATADTLTAIAGKVSEIDSAGDAWANFWRGVLKNSEAGNETLDKLGINIGKVSQIIAGSRSEYDSFVGSLRKVGEIGNMNEVLEFMRTGGLQNDPSKFPLVPGDELGNNNAKLEALKGQAEAIRKLGLDPSLFEGPNAITASSMKHLTETIDEQRLALEMATQRQQNYAKALGTTVERGKEVASIVAVIGDASQDAAGKIDAINRSLEILNNSGADDKRAEVQRIEGLEASVENAKAIAAAIKASKDVLFEADGTISVASKAGRDLFKVMDEQANHVKVQAQRTYDAAILNGDTASVAASKAVAIVRAGESDLKRIAEAAGVAPEELRTQWDKFFGAEWSLEATFSGNLDHFMEAKAEAERIGLEFDAEKFTAWLLANPDQAAITTDQVKAQMKAWAVDDYKAKLEALPASAQASLSDLLHKFQNYVDGDYTATLDAFNASPPVVQAAINDIMRLTDPVWQAKLAAMLDQGSYAAVEWQLIKLSRTREAIVNVTYADAGRDAAMAGRAPRARNGAILDRFARGMAGFNPEMVKFFANGGIENHKASIYRPSSTLRFFAEPETGGEAYIPLAVSKRPRSLGILGEVARKFGYELTRSQSFANGAAGGHAVPTRTSSTSVTVGTINTVDPDRAIKKLQDMQRDALALAGIDS